MTPEQIQTRYNFATVKATEQLKKDLTDYVRNICVEYGANFHPGYLWSFRSAVAPELDITYIITTLNPGSEELLESIAHTNQVYGTLAEPVLLSKEVYPNIFTNPGFFLTDNGVVHGVAAENYIVSAHRDNYDTWGPFSSSLIERVYTWAIDTGKSNMSLFDLIQTVTEAEGDD